MDKIEKILSLYNNYELGFMLKYKYHTYSEKSRLKIDHFLIEKKLEKENLLALTKEKRVFTDNKKRCPRCKSERYLINTIPFWGNSMYAVLEDLKTTNEEVCQICGYNINEFYKKGSNPFNKIFNWFINLIE